MKSLIRLTDYNVNDIYDIFKLTDEIRKGKHQDFLKGKSVVLFFPNTSIRTRVTFEKGIYLLGGQSILFPADTLDKKEDLRDVCGYLNNWADRQDIYKGLGCVNISVEPHFVRSEVSDELIELSKKYINSVTEILNK